MANYLAGYPPQWLAPVQALIDSDRLGESLRQRYPEDQAVRSDRALVDYVAALKRQYLRSAPPLAKVAYDARLHIVRNALGTHTAVSRVQGTQLKAKREIRIASLFKEAPAPFLKMIVVHELAHIPHKNHGKAFYDLIATILPDYKARQKLLKG